MKHFFCMVFVLMLGACSLGPPENNVNFERPFSESKINVTFEKPFSKQLTKEIIFTKNLFEPYVGFPIKIKIFSLKDSRPEFYISSTDEIGISADNFLDPKYEKQGEIGLFHELGHGLVFTLLRHKDPFAKKLIKKAYIDLVERAGFDVFKSRLDYNKTTESNPYFSIFDESSYIFGYPSELGHPYSSVGELFASTLTVIRFFPQEFSKRFKTMSLLEQRAVKDVFDTLIWTLLFINPSDDALGKLLPEHKSIKEVIEKYTSQIYS